MKVLNLPPGDGSGAIRRSLETARGELIAFIDHDVTAPPLYVAELERAARWHPEAGVFRGPVSPEYPLDAPSWLTNHRLAAAVFGRFMARRTEGILRPPRVPFCINFVVRAGELASMGFRDSIGDRGCSPSAGHDELLARLRARNVKFLYVPGTWVKRRISLHSLSGPALLEHAFDAGTRAARANEKLSGGSAAHHIDPAASGFAMGCTLNFYHGYLAESLCLGGPAQQQDLLGMARTLAWNGDRTLPADSTAKWLGAHPEFLHLPG
jgi:glycosyltransferase involved in cell wall biosynthesis